MAAPRTFYLAQESARKAAADRHQLPPDRANLFLNDEQVEAGSHWRRHVPPPRRAPGADGRENVLATIHTKTLFLSVAGVHDGAMYNQNMLLVQAERRMMEQAQEVVLLVDSAKFGQQALSHTTLSAERDRHCRE